MREKMLVLTKSREWESFILIVIIINAITLGFETSETIMQSFAGPALRLFDRAVLVIFVVEIAIRIYAHRLRFFRDPWSIFDFTIVVISLLPASGPLQVLRALRILRALRLLSMIPSLRRVIGGLIAALPGMGSIIVLMALVFYIFAVIATKLYGEAFPEWFGSLGATIYSLFQIMTLESWSMGIVRPVMEVYPNAWLFFVPFILSTAFTVLNLFIGIIVSAMQKEHEEELREEDRQAREPEMQELLHEVRALRSEVAALRQDQAPRPAPTTA
ncbi:ion transporter [Martelella endophytica]|uniref:Voltage-gated sodium channel n=1 Tax=Martelella endophytica TaxID=1486262 RepID=A0A0D5LXK3_MAREN|nr:ion transporter [Martelella endophytica]AJY48188.1 voltage-gated sodium channel [Martelella endophytica]